MRAVNGVRPRSLVSAAALAALLSGCVGGSGANQAGANRYGSEPPNALTSAVGGQPPAAQANGTRPAGQGGGVGPGGRGGGNASAGAGSGAPSAAGAAPSPTSDPVPTAARGADGSFAPFILRPEPAARLVIELMEESDAQPGQVALDHLTRVLRAVTAGKRMTVTSPTPLPAGPTDWTIDQLTQDVDGYTRQTQGAGQAVLHLEYVHGQLQGHPDVLGVAYRADSLAIFVDQVQSAGSPTLSAGYIEDVVTMHEAGHLLGLVDLYLHTGRQDPQHPGHSRNPKSVMYWAVDTRLLAEIFNGPPPRDYDSDDLNDLQTIRTTPA